MKSFILYIIATALIAVLYGCVDNTIVYPPPPVADTYYKVASAESGSMKFELWSATNDTLQTGYNKVGFKVFENSNPKSSGYVKFQAKMYHTGAADLHQTPVEPQYNYNSSLEMFTGYIIMLMPSDTTGYWYGFYNYNDVSNIDSVTFDVGFNTYQKFKIFVDIPNNLSYLITVLEPLQPARNVNNYKFMLHESPDFLSFTQVNGAQNFTKVWLDSLNHESSGNVHPVDGGTGYYEGKVNFDNGGIWRVYDSVYYNNKWITPAGNPPYVVFVVE